MRLLIVGTSERGIDARAVIVWQTVLVVAINDGAALVFVLLVLVIIVIETLRE